MMMSKKKIVLHVVAAVLLFLYFLLARMPVYVVFNHLTQYSQFVSFGEPSGKLWHGSVSDVRINIGNAPIELGFTEWNIKPWKLLLGKLSLHLHAEKQQQLINADIEVGITRFISLTDAEFVFDADLINRFYPIPGKLEGQFDINLNELNLSAKGINALEGSVVIKDSRFTFNQPVDLGTFAAKLSFAEGAVKADLSDVQASVGIKGTAHLKPDTREYDIDVTLLPAAGANPLIEQSLASFLPPATNGGFRLTKAGQL